MIYLLEDDESIRELVLYALNKTGNEALGFNLPSKLYKSMENELPELLILDVMLPEEDGLCVLKKLRDSEKTATLPIIMLTAKSSEFDKVTALDLGADDYVTKPFGVMELVARVKALLRRSAPREGLGGKRYSIGSLEVSVDKHEVLAMGKQVTLTLKEFELLCLLLENRGAVLTRDRILAEVWGYSFDGENRTVDVHIRTLRQKLGEECDYIETVRGVGYKIADK
jgi:two-component system alkaline phosphatase synthesis response regulator PhoP